MTGCRVKRERRDIKKGLSSHGLPKRSPTLVLPMPETAQLRSSNGIRCSRFSLDDSNSYIDYRPKCCVPPLPYHTLSIDQIYNNSTQLFYLIPKMQYSFLHLLLLPLLFNTTHTYLFDPLHPSTAPHPMLSKQRKTTENDVKVSRHETDGKKGKENDETGQKDIEKDGLLKNDRIITSCQRTQVQIVIVKPKESKAQNAIATVKQQKQQSFETNLDSIISLDRYLQGPQGNISSIRAANIKEGTLKVCQYGKPLFNGTHCISCQQKDILYDLQTSKCRSCQKQENYNQSTHHCDQWKYYPNINNSFWIVSSKQGIDKLKQYIKDRQALASSFPCPDDKPHYNNRTQMCQSCPSKSNKYFNYGTWECESCEGEDKKVSNHTKMCLKRSEDKYQTSLDAPRLLYEGMPKNQLWDIYHSNEQKYPGIQDCTYEAPFFDGFECIKCPSQIPLFDMLNRECTKCATGSLYVREQGLCIFSNNSSKQSIPNAEKMYTSIF